jgi:hypothetical protein
MVFKLTIAFTHPQAVLDIIIGELPMDLGSPHAGKEALCSIPSFGSVRC